MVSLMRSRSAGGFSFAELMVIVVLIGILTRTALISVQLDRFERQRQALNSTAQDLASWVDVIRSRAATGTVCTVTITANASLTAGATLASVSPTTCGSDLTLDPETTKATGTLSLVNNPTGTATITFTTSGGAQLASTATVNGYNGVEVAFSSATANLRRCLAISDGTGSLLLGGASTSGGSCSYTSPI